MAPELRARKRKGATDVVAEKSKTSKRKKVEPSPELEEEEEEVEAPEPETEEEEIDDQTAALLKGFESEDEGEDVEDDGKAIKDIPSIPGGTDLRKKLDNAGQGRDQPGVIYVGRIPHGFFEHQMRAYFSQFGDITRLRLSRNMKTGRSRHFAFIEFASSDVAEIVAKAMDKYLLFNHILQVRTIPKEQVHEDLFKNANRRFRPMPRAKIEGRKLRLPQTKEVWEKKTKKEEGRRKKKMEMLKEIGYEFEAPQLKSVTDVVVPKKAVEASTEETKAIEAPVEEPKEATSEAKAPKAKTVKTAKKAKKAKKSAA